MSEWRTIETAPKGDGYIGPSIIVCDGSGWVGEVRWFPRCYGDERNPGWMIANCDEEYGNYIDATHWMPLPEAPT